MLLFTFTSSIKKNKTMKIFKYGLEIIDKQTVTLPAGSQILSAQMQGDSLQLWAFVDEYMPVKETVDIVIIGTGNPIEYDRHQLGYIFYFPIAKWRFGVPCFFNYSSINQKIKLMYSLSIFCLWFMQKSLGTAIAFAIPAYFIPFFAYACGVFLALFFISLIFAIAIDGLD